MSIVMAFTDPIDKNPPETRYKYFTDKYTGNGVHTIIAVDDVEEFINTWIQNYDKPYGMWYWVIDDDDMCVCSGACDPYDIDIFIEHWHLEEYSDNIHDSMKTKKYVYLNSEKENKTMNTVDTIKTNKMFLDEIKAKNNQIKDVKKVERYKQRKEIAGENDTLRDSFYKHRFH